MATPLTVGDAVQKSAEYLRGKGVDSPRLDAELLLAHVLDCDRLKLYLNWDRELDEGHKQSMRELLQRRGQEREPIARIIGQREFYGRPFHVGKGSFVPRPETEWLVERSLALLKEFRRDPAVAAAFEARAADRRAAAENAAPGELGGGRTNEEGESPHRTDSTDPTDRTDHIGAKKTAELPSASTSESPSEAEGIPAADSMPGGAPNPPAPPRPPLARPLPPLTAGPRIIDIGTGTGCIAISIALERPDAEVYATDLSEDALRVARDNASALGAAHRVRFHNGDLFAGLDGPFDLVVSNPPYIASEAIEGLMPEVSTHDPRRALDGGTTGLEIYARLAGEAPDRLLPGAPFLLEIGEGQGRDVAALLEATGRFQAVRIVRDLAGLERYVEALRADAPEPA